jgi:RNA polymerase sigma-70 factor (ECF subfamily)
MVGQELDLDGLRRRNDEAIERWFRSHSGFIYTFVYYRVDGDGELASDLVQETFTTALARLDDFDPSRGKMRAWLTYIARNCIRTARRQLRRFAGAPWHGVDEGLIASIGAIGERLLPDEVLQREETAHLVRAALTRLSTDHRQVLVERYWRQRPLAAVAADLGISEGALKSRLHRARLAFRDRLLAEVDISNEEGIASEVAG